MPEVDPAAMLLVMDWVEVVGSTWAYAAKASIRKAVLTFRIENFIAVRRGMECGSVVLTQLLCRGIMEGSCQAERTWQYRRRLPAVRIHVTTT